MSSVDRDPLVAFHPIVAEWFRDRLGEPTDVQRRGWPVIRSGAHCLITAPTGSGKTLAAFLTAIDDRIRGGGARVLYVSPLKALNNDIERNLRRPLGELAERFAERETPFPAIEVMVRSGDTEPRDRRRMTSHPPDILVTTPESLNVMLASKSGRAALGGFGTVILDEIHAVLSDKRGVYLMSAVERLAARFGEFQRIAISATVKPLELVAEVVGGGVAEADGTDELVPRQVEIVDAAGEKAYELAVELPEVAAGGPSEPIEWWDGLVRVVRRRIEANRSTLVFANSRRMVEKLARLINETDGEPVYAHHGSLAREIRREVEERLKRGELAAIVATGSLELGIDIGEVDEVVLVQAPFTFAAAIQRIGRSGHGVGDVSRGLLVPLHGRDLVELAVVARAVAERRIEPVEPPAAPLDVLAQLLLAETLFEARSVAELWRLVRRTHAYRTLSRREFDLVVEMLAGRYAGLRVRELEPRVSYDRAAGTIRAREGAAGLLYRSGGVIPDRGYFGLRRVDNGARIGELDEEFVWERSVGDTFPFGNRAWTVRRITANEVEVTPAERGANTLPFWRGEALTRPAIFSRAIGEFLAMCDRTIAGGSDDVAFRAGLRRDYRLTPAAVDALMELLQRQRHTTGCGLPHATHLVLERLADPTIAAELQMVVVHSTHGGAVNRALALVWEAAWQERYGEPIRAFANNDAILLSLPAEANAAAVADLVTADDVPRLVRSALEAGELFGARFRENAQRSLLLPRRSFRERMPLWLNRLRAKQLLAAVSRERDFPVTIETWRECLSREFDLAAVARLVDDIRSGTVALSFCETTIPSPFAESIVWYRTNIEMYSGDSADRPVRTATGDDLLAEIIGSPHLRPEIPAELCVELESRLKRTRPGYAPESAEDLVSLVEERVFVPEGEWDELRAAIMRDLGAEAASRIMAAAEDGLGWVERGAVRGRVALADLVALTAMVGTSGTRPDAADAHAVVGAGPAGSVSDDERDDEQWALLDQYTDVTPSTFLERWLGAYGPLAVEAIPALAPLSREAVEEALTELTGRGAVVVDRLTVGSDVPEVCGRDNFERLLRMRRAAARSAAPALTPAEFQLARAAHHGLVQPGSSREAFERRMEQLFGWVARAELWEREILPARLVPYRRSWMDDAFRETDLRWLGAGDRRVTFAFEAERDLVVPIDRATDAQSEAIRTLREAFSGGGRYTFLDLMTRSGLASAEATAALWTLVWRGEVVADGVDALRQGVAAKFRAATAAGADGGRRVARRGGRPGRSGFARWKSSRPLAGTWYRPPPAGPPQDPLEQQELVKERVRLLVDRHVVLCRAVLELERAPLRWSDVVRAARLMELSGELVGGQFVAGIAGLQFVAAGSDLRPLAAEADAVWWMNAADPVSLCGVDIEGLRENLPSRLATTHLVFHDAQLRLVSRRSGRELDILVEPRHPEMARYLGVFPELLEREGEAGTRLRVETINGIAVAESPFRDVMMMAGFSDEGVALSMWRRW